LVIITSCVSLDTRTNIGLHRSYYMKGLDLSYPIRRGKLYNCIKLWNVVFLLIDEFGIFGCVILFQKTLEFYN